MKAKLFKQEIKKNKKRRRLDNRTARKIYSDLVDFLTKTIDKYNLQKRLPVSGKIWFGDTEWTDGEIYTEITSDYIL